MFDDEDGARRSIRFFNTLSEHNRVTIVSDLNPTTFKLKQYHSRLISLLSQVQQAISKFDDIAIGNRLVELGLDDTYARLFVSNIKKHAPTEEYQLHQLSKVPDDVFAKLMPEIIKSVLYHNASGDEIVEKFDITKEQLLCIADLSRTILNALARGDMTKETLRKRYSDKLSTIKFESLSNTILVNQKHWYDTILFSNVQDYNYNIDYVTKQNGMIIKLLSEVLDALQSETSYGRRQGR